MSLQSLSQKMETKRASIKTMLEAFAKIYLKEYLYTVSQKGSGAIYLSLQVHFRNCQPGPEILCDANVALQTPKGSRTVITGRFNGAEFSLSNVADLEKMLKGKIAAFLSKNTDLLVKSPL